MNGMYEELIEKLRKNNRMSGWTHIDRLMDDAIKAIEALQQENEQLKDENASIRNWHVCEEKLHNELLVSDKRRWELEEELEAANDYREGLEAIIGKLHAQVARMREALKQARRALNKYADVDLYKLDKVISDIDEALSDTPADYHNPADVEALKQVRTIIIDALICFCPYDNTTKEKDVLNRLKESLAQIEKAIGGKEDV